MEPYAAAFREQGPELRPPLALISPGRLGEPGHALRGSCTNATAPLGEWGKNSGPEVGDASEPRRAAGGMPNGGMTVHMTAMDDRGGRDVRDEQMPGMQIHVTKVEVTASVRMRAFYMEISGMAA